MILKSMVCYTLETIEKETSKMQIGGVALALGKINRYANFLKQPLKLEIFVPCDEEGNVLNSLHGYSITGEEERCDLQWERAKEKVLFKGYDRNKKQSELPFSIDYLLFEDGHTIEDLIEYNLELTDNAIKQLWN